MMRFRTGFRQHHRYHLRAMLQYCIVRFLKAADSVYQYSNRTALSGKSEWRRVLFEPNARETENRRDVSDGLVFLEEV